MAIAGRISSQFRRLMLARDTPSIATTVTRRCASTMSVPKVQITYPRTKEEDDSLQNRRDKKRQLREVYASMNQVKSSPMKLNLVAKLIRGMSVLDALAQLKFCEKKASKFVEMAVLDAQRRAEQTYDLNPVNLHVAESYVGKGTYLKRIRYHGKGQFGRMHKYYSHYYLKLREGPPPMRKKRTKIDHKSCLTWKYIRAGPRRIPSSL